jgi:hypothetical protein
MTTPTKPLIDIQSNPVVDIAPVQLHAGDFDCQIAYARSAEAYAMNEYNQDAFALRVTTQRLVAVVADGVGQSFRGDVAAMAVAQTITQVLWQIDLTNEALVREVLCQQLIALVPKVTQLIHDVDISRHPTIFREALMQRRDFGSESVFVAVVIDTHTNHLICYWMGDCRLRIYDQSGSVVPIAATQFQTMERWSSSRMIYGELHMLSCPANAISRVVLYSDGLHTLDSFPLTQGDLTNVLSTHIATSRTSPESDDISLVVVDVRR